MATFTIAAVSWLALVWRRRRAEERAGRLLLLVVYLAGASIGNHLLALLAGPGIVGFLVVTLSGTPRPSRWRRRLEWGQVAVVAGVWALLIGTGLGSTELIALGGACFVAAAVYAGLGGAGGFALAALLIAAVGVTPYLYIYLRAAQHPVINEAAPATFDALLAVIRRAQYPPRTPLDDPTVPHGPGNPGRTLSLLGWQLLNYFQYFDWQWARSLADGIRTVVTVLFVGLGTAWDPDPMAERPRRRLAPARALPGDRARAGRLHEFPAGLQPRLSPLAQARRPRGAGAGLFLRGELHRLGSLGRHRRRRHWPDASEARRSAAGSPPSCCWRWCRSDSTGPPPAGGMVPTPGLRRTSPTTCSTACRRTACCSPTATTTPSRSGGPRRSRASART